MTIKKIIDPVFGIIDNYVINNKGLIILPSKIIELDNKSEQLAFINNEDTTSGLIINKFISIETILHNLNREIINSIFTIGFVNILCSLLINALYFIISYHEIRKSILIGQKLNRIYLNNIKFQFCLCAVLCFMELLFCILLNLYLYGVMWIPSRILMIFIIPLIFALIDFFITKQIIRRT